MSLTHQLAEYVSACFTGIWIVSHEQSDALAEIAQMCREQSWRLATWNIEEGLRLQGQPETRPADAGANDPLAAIRAAGALGSPESSAILVMQNAHRFLGSPEIVQAVAQQVLAGKQRRVFIVILAPTVAIPDELQKLFTVLEHDLPDRDQLAEIARGVATEQRGPGGRGGVAARPLADQGHVERRRSLFDVPRQGAVVFFTAAPSWGGRFS